MSSVLYPVSFDQCPQEALKIVKTLQAHGCQAVFAGGCVRDMLMGRRPHDWDIATSARPEQVEELFPHTYAVGKQFGIITVVGGDHENYEVASFRGDVAYSDGRHPDAIRFVDMAEDVRRRDFTCNALLGDPVAGVVHDFVEGVSDLKAGVLRAVGEPARRFEEDKLRVLRAVRFAAALGFEIEPATWAAVQSYAGRVAGVVSIERIASELEKMLLSGHGRRAMELLDAAGLLAEILPELTAFHGVEQPPQFHPEGDVWNHQMKLQSLLDETIRRCQNASADAPRFNAAAELQRASADELRGLVWGALLHDVGKPPTCRFENGRYRFNGHDVVGAKMAEEILRKLRLPNEVIETAVYLVRNHMSLTMMHEARMATRRRKLQEPLFPLLLEIVRLDSLASFGDLSLHDWLVGLWEEEMRRPAMPHPTIMGRDLIALGVAPCPEYQPILRAAFDHELEKPFADHAAAVEWLKGFLHSRYPKLLK
ncbi:MAG: CCA tRNA nucleotidyltransferase [Victivallales bacterium]|nr:CCA tRNA nucleotidyltransferase [Victivallales bacterium]